MNWKDSINVPVSAQGEWAAKRYYGDPELASRYLPVAYALLGEVKHRMALGGVSYGQRIAQLPDGTIVRVMRNNEQNILEIRVPERVPERVPVFPPPPPPPPFFDIDFLLVEYSWTSAGGRDLDTRTQITAPFLSAAYGWCADNPISPYITWGGDNTSTPGAEAALLNFINIREDYPGVNIIKIRTAAWWYGERFSGDISVNFYAWVGGTMVKSTNTWVNDGGTQTANLTTSRNVVPQSSFCSMATTGIQELGSASYNITTREWTY